MSPTASYSAHGYADQGYQEPDTPAYPDQGYSEYGHGGQDYQARGDTDSYQDQGYSTFGYDGQDNAYRSGSGPYPDQDSEATAGQQAVSSFPYETDPPTRREQRRRRGRY